MKTKEELSALKEELEVLNKKLAELTDDELKQVSGGDGQMKMTKMECDTCGLVTCMPGNLLGKSVPCTRYIEGEYCKGSLIGVSTYWDDI